MVKRGELENSFGYHRYKKKRNGFLHLPYVGYLRLVVETEGVMYPWCGLLVMKDSFDEATQEKRKMILGITGAFILSTWSFM